MMDIEWTEISSGIWLLIKDGRHLATIDVLTSVVEPILSFVNPDNKEMGLWGDRCTFHHSVDGMRPSSEKILDAAKKAVESTLRKFDYI
jgi:hypothetical protein